MASAAVAKVGYVNFQPLNSQRLNQNQISQQQFSRNRFVVLCSGKGRDIISIDQRKVNINLPLLGGASFSKPNLEEKLSLETRFRFSFDISIMSKLNTEMQRRSFSLYLIFTAVCLMGPAATALASRTTDTDTEIPEYGPELPKKDISFQGHVFLAKVRRPQALLASETQRNLLETANEFDEGFGDEEQEFTPEGFDEEPEEVLELSIEVPRSQRTAFDVFINLPKASESSPITLPEYVGSYGGEVDTRPGIKRTKVRFGIGERIKQLHLQKEPSILVTIVRHGDTEGKPIMIKDIDIALEE